MLKIYTKTGDDGTTGLLFGGRVRKDSALMQITGTVDEAQAVLGTARAEAIPDSELDLLLTRLERDLYVLMAEVATADANRHKLQAGVSLVSEEMVSALEQRIDGLTALFPPLKDFVVPGHDPVSASLDVARTAVRRAEREVLGSCAPDSLVARYLNRLSDLVWTMARWQEQGESLLSRKARER